MFEGGGFGVGVTVTPLDVDPWPVELLPPGVSSHPARLGELLPVHSRTDGELAAELARVVQVEGVLAAYKAELVTAFAARRPDTLDVPHELPGSASPGWAVGPDQAPGVSEFFADELALVLNCSRTAATILTEQSTTLVTGLPGTWAALADGSLDWPRARVLATELGWPARDTDPAIVAAVEATVLPVAASLSARGLQAAVRAELLRRDPAAADRRRKQAERHADVTVAPTGDGMAELKADLPQPMAAACRDTVDGYARLAKADGDTRPLGQLRAGVLADLILRPWETSRPPLTAHLDVFVPLGVLHPDLHPSPGFGPAAGNGGAPGPAEDTAGRHSPDRDGGGGPGGGGVPGPLAEVDGQPITATHLRELLEHLDALCPGGLQTPTGGTLTFAIVDPDTGELRATATRTDLERLTRRGCPHHPPPHASDPPDPSRPPEPCGCPILDRPPPIDRYRPTPAQRRFVTTRDRTCRHPGCANPAGWADLDHVTAHAAGGDTDCTNLCCQCRRHHRLKTHAHGWQFTLTGDGTYTVTTPSGITRTTRPPGLHPLGKPEHQPPPPTPQPDDDPPPF